MMLFADMDWSALIGAGGAAAVLVVAAGVKAVNDIRKNRSDASLASERAEVENDRAKAIKYREDLDWLIAENKKLVATANDQRKEAEAERREFAKNAELERRAMEIQNHKCETRLAVAEEKIKASEEKIKVLELKLAELRDEKNGGAL